MSELQAIEVAEEILSNIPVDKMTGNQVFYLLLGFIVFLILGRVLNYLHNKQVNNLLGKK